MSTSVCRAVIFAARGAYHNYNASSSRFINEPSSSAFPLQNELATPASRASAAAAAAAPPTCDGVCVMSCDGVSVHICESDHTPLSCDSTRARFGGAAAPRPASSRGEGLRGEGLRGGGGSAAAAAAAAAA